MTETVDQVVAKYVQSLGGQQTLQNAKTRVMTGTVTNRDLTTANVTVTEKNTGEYRSELSTQPNPTIRPKPSSTGKRIGGIAMTTELEAILDSNLVTMVFLYGSAAMLIASLAAATWLGRSAESTMILRTRVAS